MMLDEIDLYIIIFTFYFGYGLSQLPLNLMDKLRLMLLFILIFDGVREKFPKIKLTCIPIKLA